MSTTHASVFSGIGAAEIAAEMLGWQNAFHCEINPFCRKILDFYFPNAESYEDITKTNFDKWRGRIDVLTGGFPCQPFSYAGKRKGSEDDRYLWPFMLRCIEQIRPTWFIGENVAGITTMAFPSEDVKVEEQTDLFGAHNEVYERRERYILHEIIVNLERAGYSVQPLLIPACAVGAPHRRDRVFIIAHRNVADTNRNGQSTPRQQGGCQWQEMDGKCKIQPLAGVRRFGNARTASNTCCNQRRTSSESREPEENRGYRLFQPCKWCNQTKRIDGLSDVQGNATNTNDDGLQETRTTEPSAMFDGKNLRYLQPENRWRAFPTVSPVYRGNDGLPFDVDDLTISFAKWKNESLKAYGNAIVVQVMYEIFRAIDEIEKLNNNKI